MAERVIIGLAGYAGSGKDTVAGMLAPLGFTRLALADPLKAACLEIFGFTREQLTDPTLKEAEDPRWGFSPRWAMQRLGTEGVRSAVADDVWVRSLMRRVEATPGHVVVTDVRFPNEAEAIRAVGGRLWLVERPGCEPKGEAHASEALPRRCDLFDRVVDNGGTLHDLTHAVADALTGSFPETVWEGKDLPRVASEPPRSALKDRTWLRVATELSALGTCRRLRVGCVLLRPDGSVAGVGYNGALPGAPHCQPEDCGPGARCLRTRHAERSALDYSQGSVETAYVTDEPCLRCTLDLCARGVRRVVFSRSYAPPPEEAAERARQVVHHGLRWERLEVPGNDSR